MLPPRKTQCPEDRASDVEVVLNWMRSNSVPPVSPHDGKPTEIGELPSISVNKWSPEDRKKDTTTSSTRSLQVLYYTKILRSATDILFIICLIIQWLKVLFVKFVCLWVYDVYIAIVDTTIEDFYLIQSIADFDDSLRLEANETFCFWQKIGGAIK